MWIPFRWHFDFNECVMKGDHLSCTIFPFHLSDFETFSLGGFNQLLMTTMPFGNHHLRPFSTGRHQSGRLSVLQSSCASRFHAYSFANDLYPDRTWLFLGRRAEGKGNGSLCLFLGTWEYHGIWETYRLYSLDSSLILLLLSFSFSPFSFHFISLSPLFLCLLFLMDAMITTSRRDFVFVPYRSQHRVASSLSCMLASRWIAFGF